MNLLSNIRSLSLTLAATGLLAHSASADMIAKWIPQNTGVQTVILAADWNDNVSQPTGFTGFGGVAKTGSSGMPFVGYSQSLDFTKYAGFSVTPLAGFQMTLTDITFMHQADGVSSVTFGYRIDEGQGFGDWTGLQAYTPGFFEQQSLDIVDFTTTGTVEFGFFAVGVHANVSQNLLAFAGTDLSVNGTTAPSAVPEPGAYALVLSGLAVCAFITIRRRKLATLS